MDVSTGVEEDVAEIRVVKLGETELLVSPEIEPLAVTLPPDVDGVLSDSIINLDVRKQTSQPVSITSTRCSSP